MLVLLVLGYLLGAAFTAALYSRWVRPLHLTWEDVASFSLWPVLLAVMLTVRPDKEVSHG